MKFTYQIQYQIKSFHASLHDMETLLNKLDGAFFFYLRFAFEGFGLNKLKKHRICTFFSPIYRQDSAHPSRN